MLVVGRIGSFAGSTSAMLHAVAHYVIRVARPAEIVSGADEWELRLVVTGEGAQRGVVSVRLTGDRASDADAPDVWRAALFCAVQELEIAFKGEGWGVHLHVGGPIFVVEVTDDMIARFLGEPSSGISLDDGAVVGEFSL